jgi:sulfite reductase alpha subunit-like flavoprotein
MDIPLSIWTLLLGAVLLAVYFYLNKSSASATFQKPAFPASNEQKLSPQKVPVAEAKKQADADVIPEGFKPITILFGSQSGNAQHFAQELGKEVRLQKL